MLIVCSVIVITKSILTVMEGCEITVEMGSARHLTGKFAGCESADGVSVMIGLFAEKWNAR